MDPFFVATGATFFLVVFILAGMHIAAAMVTIGVSALWIITGGLQIPMSILGITAHRGIMQYIFGTAPLFIVMGLLANMSGISDDLFDAAHLFLRRVRGGLAIATVISNAFFAAITGISIASAAVFSRVAVPQMMRLGYNQRLALGTVAGSSILGMLIPPSILLIIYGILAEVSIGQLFIAGILPGLLITLVYSVGIVIMALWRPEIAPTKLPGEQERTGSRIESIKTIIRPWPVLIIMFVVLGGIYLGFVTPTEAAAVGAMGTFLITIFQRKLTARGLWAVLLETGNLFSAIGFLIISALFFSKMLVFSGFTAGVTQWVTSLDVPPMVILWSFMCILILLGAFLDSTSIMMISIPLLVPIAEALGFNLIWFGIVCIIAIEMGLVTPPFGMCVFAIKIAMGDEVAIEDIFIGAAPFVLMMLVALTILIYFPAIVMVLPDMM